MFSESRTRVRYKETDQMGIAHHSNYLVWFEIGRTDLCRTAVESYRAIEGSAVMSGSIASAASPPLRPPICWQSSAG